MVENASTVELTQSGYVAIARLRDGEAMAVFIHRVLDKENLVVIDEGRLRGMVPFYDGECATQSYEALVQELRKGRNQGKCSHPWLQLANETRTLGFLEVQKQPWNPQSWWNRVFHHSAVESTQPANSTTVNKMNVGTFSTLDNPGYAAVAAAASKIEMEIFVYRLLEREKLRVLDEGALQGMLRFYDGTCATQSFDALVAELHRVLIKPKSCFGGPWLEAVE